MTKNDPERAETMGASNCILAGFTYLRAVRTSGARPPLFFFCPGEPGARTMVEFMPEDQPIYEFYFPNIDGMSTSKRQGSCGPLAHFVGMHTLMCFYMTEGLPTRDTGLIFDGDKIVSHIPPVHNLKTFFKLRDLAVDIFQRAGHFVLARRRFPYLFLA